MKAILIEEVIQVFGGKCDETYQAEVPITYLPIISEYLKKLNKHQFNANEFLQALNDAGLDTSQVMLNVSVSCFPSSSIF